MAKCGQSEAMEVLKEDDDPITASLNLLRKREGNGFCQMASANQCVPKIKKYNNDFQYF